MQEQERKRQGIKEYVPAKKEKPKVRNIAKEKRDRMDEYGRKVTGNVPLKFTIDRPEVKEIDYKDVKNWEGMKKSDFD